MNPSYKRILLKISGEYLAGDNKTGINFEIVLKLAKILKEISQAGVQVAVVVGGGNFWRGRSSGHMNRVKADHMGMMATVINSLALSDCLDQVGCEASLLTSVHFPQVGELYSPEKAISYLEKGKVVIFGYGTGNAFFSTDTAASLRACEINAEIVLKATGVDGVYSGDPKKDSSAKKYETITFDEMLSKNLKVIDSTAASMHRDNQIPILIFNITPLDNIISALNGISVGTLVLP